MLKFDNAKSTDEVLALLQGLIRIRLLIMRGIGWPKEPSMKAGKLPAALESVKHQDPLGDIAIDALVVRQSERSEGG